MLMSNYGNQEQKIFLLHSGKQEQHRIIHWKDFTFGKSDFILGEWDLVVEARGYGITAPVDQLSFHDHFEVYATITKPCIRFPEIDDVGECTFVSDLKS